MAFAYYDRLSPLSPVKANINSASIAELAAIPEMSFDLAQEIVSLRQQDGKYRNLVDLSSRLNLDSHLTSQLMHYLRF
ncbi:MAG: hypothetical protein HC930_12570 [Hydrococcus sp. SU_1_0]|nr:hypothetical protein [Hydrococcus sp. SU_1_0]